MADLAQMSLLRLTLILYPFGAGAMAVNLFFASLIASWIGAAVLTPVQSLIGGLVLGWPATWLFARHIKRLMARADEQTDVCRQDPCPKGLTRAPTQRSGVSKQVR